MVRSKNGLKKFRIVFLNLKILECGMQIEQQLKDKIEGLEAEYYT